MFKVGFLVILACSAVFGAAVVPEKRVKLEKYGKDFHLLVNEDGEEKFVNLFQADDDILSGLGQTFQFTIADIDEFGNQIFRNWEPNLGTARKNIYINSESRAGFHIQESSEEELEVNGFFENLLIRKEEKEFKVQTMQSNKNDFRNLPRNLTYVNNNQFADSIDATVEFVIVADKEFCDVFSHDYQRILEYFIVMMWDVNLRYKTLPRARISWQLNGIVAIANKDAQPFIEEARAADGRVEHGRVLDKFGVWVYQNLGNLPTLDVASVITNAEQEWGGGLAWVGAACHSDNGYYYGTSVWNDGGNYGAINVMAHELGHNMGGPHDSEPCDGTFIMGGSTDEHRYFFSTCSDGFIGDYVRSDQASCLQVLSSNNPVTSPDFNSPPAPTMTQQCARRHPQDSNVFTSEETCMSARCHWTDESGQGWYQGFPPLDNSPCGTNGRCFRGKCRNMGHIIKNIGSSLCMEPTNNFDKTAVVQLNQCPSVGTALQRFVITTGLKGTFLETPFIQNGGESIDKCLYTGNGEGNQILTDVCGDHNNENDNPWHGWELVELGNNEFMLKHIISGRCAIPLTRAAGADVITSGACDSNNGDYKWTKYL